VTAGLGLLVIVSVLTFVVGIVGHRATRRPVFARARNAGFFFTVLVAFAIFGEMQHYLR
jgi:hypothetical protein